MKKIKGVIFDLDGTLLDTIQDIASSVNAVLHQHGLKEYTVQDYKNFVGSGAKVLIERATGSQDDAVTLPILNEYKQYYAQHSADTTVPYPGIPEMLATLSKDYQLAVLSNKPHSDTEALIQKYFQQIPFCCVYGQRDGFPRKPDPAGILKIIEEMQLSAEEIAYVGDSENDILAANNAHVFAIGVLWGFRTQDQIQAAGSCQAFCKHPDEMIAILEEENRVRQ